MAGSGRPAQTGEDIDTLTELEAWYARENGQFLLSSTLDATRGILDTAFGYHLLQTGCTRGHALFADSPINHRIYVAERPGEQVNLLARADELPLESDSIDTVIAHHALDFADDPRQVLREIQRVLTPQGQLLVIGFNPRSPQGVSRRLRGLNRNALWHYHTPVSESRLTDWLHLLGCEVQACIRLAGIPLAGRGMVRRCLMNINEWSNRHNLPTGSVYILHAIKHVSAVRQPRRQWQLRRARLIGLVPKPAPSPTPYRPGAAGAAAQRKPREEGTI